MDLRGLMPSFADDVRVDEVTVRRDGDVYIVACRVAPTAQAAPAPLTKPTAKPTAKPPTKPPTKPLGRLGAISPGAQKAHANEESKAALVAFLREQGSATGVEITQRFGWKSSRQSTVIRAARQEGRVRLLGQERTTGGLTLRYAAMDPPLLEGTFRGALSNGSSSSVVPDSPMGV